MLEQTGETEQFVEVMMTMTMRVAMAASMTEAAAASGSWNKGNC